MSDLTWALCSLAVAALAWDGFRRWLGREGTTVRELRAELTGTQADWGRRFAKHEAAHAALESRVASMQPNLQPLGKHYSTRGG